MSALLVAALSIGALHGHAGALKSYPLPFGFTADLPAKPEPFKEKFDASVKAFVSSSEAGLFIITDTSIKIKDAPKLSNDQALAAYVVGALESFGDGHITKYSDVLLNGWPGVEITIEDAKDGTTIWSRCFAIGDDIVEIGAVYDTAEGAPTNTADVLASLKQVGNARKGPLESSDFDFAPLNPDGLPVHLDFPGEAKAETTTDGDESKLVIHHYTACRDMRLFDFTYGELPEGTLDDAPSDGPEKLRQMVMDALLHDLDAQADSSTTEQRDGNDWLTTRFKVKDYGFGRADVLYLNGRVYSIVAVGPEAWLDAPEFKRFFDSVEVKN